MGWKMKVAELKKSLEAKDLAEKRLVFELKVALQPCSHIKRFEGLSPASQGQILARVRDLEEPLSRKQTLYRRQRAPMT